MEQKKNKIILHTCCAICSGYPIHFLQESGCEVICYFCNPNIYPETEYQKRLEAEKIICGHFNCELVEEKYNPEEFYGFVKGLEDEPERGERCDKCFELRLRKTAQFAKQRGVKNFTTSIVISPHKNFQKLSEIGQKIVNETGLNYVSIDFKKKDGFLKTNKIARELGLYRQNYCGCKFSLR